MILSLAMFDKAIYKLFTKAIAFSLGIILAIALTNLSSVNAQNVRPEMAAAEVYRSLNEFPRENQHLSRQTGQPATDNTLVSRIIRYHQYVKNRPVEYRLDWKLTLADYLGANESIEVSSYPGNTTLKNNPLESDRAAISQLDRDQRNELINTLVSIYQPQATSPENSSSQLDADDSQNQQPSSNGDNRQKIPQRGSADLLLPEKP